MREIILILGLCFAALPVLDFVLAPARQAVTVERNAVVDDDEFVADYIADMASH
ncbi:MAG: hypothetical protein WCH39_01705 [Schlesneria sp.]